MKTEQVTLLIPTLNEIEGMRQIMPMIDRSWVSQILVADGGSTDGTVEYARSQGYDVFVQERKGIRHAYIEAMKHIKGDVIITFSPDGNSLPALIPSLIQKLHEGYDMVDASELVDEYKGSHMLGFLVGNIFGGLPFFMVYGAYRSSVTEREHIRVNRKRDKEFRLRKRRETIAKRRAGS